MSKTNKKFYPMTVRLGVDLKKIVDDILVKRRLKSPRVDMRQSDVVRDLMFEGAKTLKG